MEKNITSIIAVILVAFPLMTPNAYPQSIAPSLGYDSYTYMVYFPIRPDDIRKYDEVLKEDVLKSEAFLRAEALKVIKDLPEITPLENEMSDPSDRYI